MILPDQRAYQMGVTDLDVSIAITMVRHNRPESLQFTYNRINNNVCILVTCTSTVHNVQLKDSVFMSAQLHILVHPCST